MDRENVSVDAWREEAERLAISLGLAARTRLEIADPATRADLLARPDLVRGALARLPQSDGAGPYRPTQAEWGEAARVVRDLGDDICLPGREIPPWWRAPSGNAGCAIDGDMLAAARRRDARAFVSLARRALAAVEAHRPGVRTSNLWGATRAIMGACCATADPAEHGAL